MHSKELNDLAVRVGKKLLENNLSLVTAESCTGGLIGNLITDIPGSSAYFAGGIIAYSNEVKEKILGVSNSDLLSFGAVSEPVAIQMAQGARRLLDADLAVSVTGIAGPGGGSLEKPVGLTWIGLSSADHSAAYRYVWSGDRVSNKRSSAEEALKVVLRYINNL